MEGTRQQWAALPASLVFPKLTARPTKQRVQSRAHLARVQTAAAAGDGGGGGAEDGGSRLTRRGQLALTAAAAALAAAGRLPAAAAEEVLSAPDAPPAVAIPDYALPGPFAPVRLPQLEHVAAILPLCTDVRCRLQLHVVYPKGGPPAGLQPPFPLAVIRRVGRKGAQGPRCALQERERPDSDAPLPAPVLQPRLPGAQLAVLQLRRAPGLLGLDGGALRQDRDTAGSDERHPRGGPDPGGH